MYNQFLFFLLCILCLRKVVFSVHRILFPNCWPRASSESFAVSSFSSGDVFPSRSDTVFTQCPEPSVVSPSHESSSSSSVQLIQPVFIYTSSLPPTSKPHSDMTVPSQTSFFSQDSIIPSYSPLHCTCTKTRCLKLYCDCLKAGRVCTDMCGCTHCLNRPDSRERERVLKRLRKTNPEAFIKVTKVKGYENCVMCTCQKSMCNKKYCSCYQSGRYCTSRCKCVECNNKSSDVLSWSIVFSLCFHCVKMVDVCSISFHSYRPSLLADHPISLSLLLMSVYAVHVTHLHVSLFFWLIEPNAFGIPCSSSLLC